MNLLERVKLKYYIASVEGINKRLKEVDESAVTMVDREQFRGRLSDLYKLAVNGINGRKAFQSQYMFLLGEIFRKYGRLFYETHPNLCMRLMWVSLNAQFVAAGLYKNFYFDLTIDHSLAQLFSSLHDNMPTSFITFITTDVKAITDLITNKKLKHEVLTNLGSTIRWLTKSLLKYAPPEKQNTDLDRLSALSEAVLLAANDEKAKIELADMYFNVFYTIELRKNPKDLGKAHAWLDKATALNPTEGMQARVAYRKYYDLAEEDSTSAAAGVHFKKAFELITFLPEESERAYLYHLQAVNLLKKENFKEADEMIQYAVAYATNCRGQRELGTDMLLDKRRDRSSFGLYDLAKAKIKYRLGEKEIALTHVNRARDTFIRFYQDKLKKEADILKALILDDSLSLS